MASTFGSLNIAKTGLQYQQVAIDTANNNISNVNTDGYVRRRAVAAEIGGPGQPVAWSVYDGHGQGVQTQSVSRLSDLLMDKRARTEHANLSFLTVQQAGMERIEATVNEPSDVGVASMMTDFGKAWQDVVNAPDGDAARASVIAAGKSLAAAINTQARGLSTEVEQQQAAVTQNVTQVNGDAQKLAQLNRNIFMAQANGSDVSDLEDQRDKLALDLANKAGAVVEVQPDGRFTAKIGNAYLVPPAGTGLGPDVANTLVVNNLSSAGDPVAGTAVSFDIYAAGIDPTDPAATPINGGSPVSLTSGELGGESVLLNYTIKNYHSQLNDLAVKLNNVINAQHQAGLDKAGQPGGAFFSFDSSDPAGSLAVVITDPSKIAATKATQTDPATGQALATIDPATGLPVTSNDATNADLVGQALLGKPTSAVPTTGGLALDSNGTPINAVNIHDLYQGMVAGLGSVVAGINTQTTNQQLLANQVDDEREQNVGVSIDEETINLMAAQRAYQASSRVLSVMDNILDTLINHTGA